jgi:site-specific recombinase XerD
MDDSDETTTPEATDSDNASTGPTLIVSSNAAPSLDGRANLLKVDLLPRFLERFERAHTRRSYRTDLEQFFEAGSVNVSQARDVTFMDVNRHIRELEQSNRKPSTIQRRISAIRGFFDWLLALEAVERNPADKNLIRRVRTVRRQDQTITFLTRDQARQLLRATDEAGEASQRDRALILTLLHCVLRRSEAASMDLGHIRPLGHYWVLDLPDAKGGTDQYVKVPAHVVEAIHNMADVYGITSGALWRSFSNRNRGDRLTPDAIYKMVKRTAQRAGLPEIGAHVLRHTGCTLAIESGATVEQVKTHARHKDIDTTMNYIHQRDKLRDSAADRIHID